MSLTDTTGRSHENFFLQTLLDFLEEGRSSGHQAITAEEWKELNLEVISAWNEKS
jgi:hypothetical protein